MDPNQINLLAFDLSTALRNIGVGWKRKADQVRADAESQWRAWQAQTPEGATGGMAAGLLQAGRDQKAWQDEVADFLDRAASAAMAEMPTLLVTSKYLRHPVVFELMGNLRMIYQAAEAQGRVVEDRPVPPPPPTVPISDVQPETRDNQLAIADYEQQIRRAVEATRQFGVDGIELSATLARDPEAMARINQAQTEFVRKLNTVGA